MNAAVNRDWNTDSSIENARDAEQHVAAFRAEGMLNESRLRGWVEEAQGLVALCDTARFRHELADRIEVVGVYKRAYFRLTGKACIVRSAA